MSLAAEMRPAFRPGVLLPSSGLRSCWWVRLVWTNLNINQTGSVFLGLWSIVCACVLLCVCVYVRACSMLLQLWGSNGIALNSFVRLAVLNTVAALSPFFSCHFSWNSILYKGAASWKANCSSSSSISSQRPPSEAQQLHTVRQFVTSVVPTCFATLSRRVFLQDVRMLSYVFALRFISRT